MPTCTSVVSAGVAVDFIDYTDQGIFELRILDSILANNTSQNVEAAGSAVYAQRTNTKTVVHNSCITGNDRYTVGGDSLNMDLSGNWWGNPLGPDSNTADSYTYSNYNFSNHLTAPPDLGPDLICDTGGVIIPTLTPTPTLTPEVCTASASGEVSGASNNCEIPSAELDYYNTFRGVMFWIIYNETSENKMVHYHDLLENQLGQADPQDPNAFVMMPGPEIPQEKRDVRYMFARTVLNNVPSYDQGNEESGYEVGYGYTRNWGGSINNPYNDDLWNHYRGCSDTNNHYNNGILPPYADIANSTEQMGVSKT